MQEFAKSKGMEVIPLVQTFGHMEVSQTSCVQQLIDRLDSVYWLPSLLYYSLC